VECRPVDRRAALQKSHKWLSSCAFHTLKPGTSNDNPEALNMSMHFKGAGWILQGVIITGFALFWAVPAHAVPCNAVRLDEQSLALHWDDLTIAGCLLEAQKLKTEMDKDPIEAAFDAMDDFCAQLETNRLSGDIPTTAAKVCAKLRGGIEGDPAH
jgi:hypothetical protein